MIYMAEHLEKLKKQEKNAAIISSIFLGLAMLFMALWGWTPLKNIVPAITVLTLFATCMILAILGAAFRIYRGIQVRALTAKAADAD